VTDSRFHTKARSHAINPGVVVSPVCFVCASSASRCPLGTPTTPRGMLTVPIRSPVLNAVGLPQHLTAFTIVLSCARGHCPPLLRTITSNTGEFEPSPQPEGCKSAILCLLRSYNFRPHVLCFRKCFCVWGGGAEHSPVVSLGGVNLRNHLNLIQPLSISPLSIRHAITSIVK